MRVVTRGLLAASALLLFAGTARASSPLLAAVLPGSRSVPVGTPATAFATIVNTGATTATGCRPALGPGLPVDLAFQATDPATNAVVGTPNAPADIPARGAKSFVVALTPTGPLPPTEVRLDFACDDAGLAPSVVGLNTLLLSGEASSVPDVVASPATLNADGVVNVPGERDTGVFSVAAINLGAGGAITAVADTGGAPLPLELALCRTDPGAGACLPGTLPAPAVDVEIAAGEAATFAVLVTSAGAVPFDPARHRVFVRFTGPDGRTRGSASVAVRTLAPAPGPPAASGAAAITPDGGRLIALNVEAAAVAVIDTVREAQVAEVPLGAEPRALALSPDGRRLFVTLDGPPVLAVVDLAALAVVSRIPVGAGPYGVVADPHGDLVYVAAAALDRVEIVHAGLGRVIASIPTAARPTGLALSGDGRRLLVTHFLSGQLSVIATLARTVTDQVATGADSNMAQKALIHPSNGRAYLPHIRSNTANRAPLFDTAVFPVLSTVELAPARHLPAERVDLSLGEHSVNLPLDVALAPDGARAYVANFGSGDLSVVNLALRSKLRDVDVGDGPRAVALHPGGSRAYVINALSEDVSVVDLAALAEVKRIPLTPSSRSPLLRRGKLLFFSSRDRALSKERWMSCASCHFDGDHDGRTWFFAGRGPRNTTSLRGLGDTRPLHWSADRDEVQDFEATIRELQAGTGLLLGPLNPPLGAPNAGRSADLDALTAFVESLRPKPSPFGASGGGLTVAAQRGEVAFHRADVGCAACHPAPRFTDSALPPGPPAVHDVGTGGGLDEGLGPAFDAPSLRGVWDSAPYLHDGSAPTLRDVLTTRNAGDRHGTTSHLSQQELEDLIAYLRSL